MGAKIEPKNFLGQILYNRSWVWGSPLPPITRSVLATMIVSPRLIMPVNIVLERGYLDICSNNLSFSYGVSGDRGVKRILTGAADKYY